MTVINDCYACTCIGGRDFACSWAGAGGRVTIANHCYACTGGRVTGEQRLNGQPKTKATLARVMGYVEQNDIHTPALTVVESLQFSAHLRLDRSVNKRQEHNFVNNVGLVP